MRGVDYEKTMEEYHTLKAEGYALYKEEEKRKAVLVTQKEFAAYKVRHYIYICISMHVCNSHISHYPINTCAQPHINL